MTGASGASDAGGLADEDRDREVGANGGSPVIYRPGESVNGFILGTDGQWHPQKESRRPSRMTVGIVAGIGVAVLMLAALGATWFLPREDESQVSAQAEPTDTPEQVMTGELQAIWDGMKPWGREFLCGALDFAPLRESAFDSVFEKVVADSDFTEAEAQQILTDEMFDDYFTAECAAIG